MKVPSEIILRVLDADAAKPISGVSVLMRVHAGRKNPFYIEFPKTDASGFAMLTGRTMRDQFDAHYEFAMMDYDGSLDSASPVVQLLVSPKSDVACEAAEIACDLHQSNALDFCVTKKG